MSTQFDKEVFGMSFPSSQLVNVDDKFDCLYDDDEQIVYVSKEVFHHGYEDEPDELQFDYRYMIESMYCDGNRFYTLYLVPELSSLSDKNKKSILEFCGIEENEANAYDVQSYGCSIIMGHEMVNDTEDNDDDKVNCIASIFETMDSLRGFYLDRYQNRIGNTGWDYLNDYIKDIDSTKVALDRWKKEKSENS